MSYDYEKIKASRLRKYKTLRHLPHLKAEFTALEHRARAIAKPVINLDWI